MEYNLPDVSQYRYIAILNKKGETGRLMNALGHMANGLGKLVSESENTCFVDYYDQDEGVHPSISHYPYIVLKADNSNKIRKVREEALERNIAFVDFTTSMFVGETADQLVETKNSPESELEYLGICMFGDTKTLKEFTSKYSLFT